MKTLIISIFIILLSGCSGVNPKEQVDDLYLGGYEGVWRGTLVGNSGKDFPFYSSSVEINMKIEIADGSVRVYTLKNGINVEVKPGAFKLLVHKTNAIVYSMNSSPDIYDKTGKGGWVETWNITLTHGEKNSLYGTYIRAVNNYLISSVDKNSANSRAFYSFSGELRKEP